MIDIEINGKKLKVEPGTMIIEAADNAGIHIPRFCYHKKLSIAANCRMCLVEVENVPKPLPACATPVTPDMKVKTQSPRAIEAQKAVMEFLLINHPLDCPVCDQGGQCELQDISMGYGNDVSRYTENKRVVDDEDLGSLIATEMTRCIHCTRCVRFGEEVAGVRELGVTGRGEHSKIGTYIKHSMQSELSGNIIDLCPVGALTSKPFRFTARAWELNQHPSIAAHDCVGSNLSVHTRRGKVMRVTPRENEALNETWISDRDRFSYTGLYSDDRVTQPMIKQNGEWVSTDWTSAFDFIAEGLSQIKSQHGSEQIAGLISANATIEEQYLWQKLLRGIECPNIDHRLQQTDFSAQTQASLFPQLGTRIAELENMDSILLIGSDICREQPILGHRLRKATHKAAKIYALNPIDFDFHFPLQEKIISAPQHMLQQLAAVVKVVADDSLPDTLKTLLNDIAVDETARQIATGLQAGSNTHILLGAIAQNHPHAATIQALAQYLAKLTQSGMGILSTGANSAGAWISGCLPHRSVGGKPVDKPGLDAAAIMVRQLKAYLLFNLEPELDCAIPHHAHESLANAELVVAFTPYKQGAIVQHADVILPITPYTEMAGTFINNEGHWQAFAAATDPQDEARPGWKILRVLGNFLELTDFHYNDLEEVRAELTEQLKVHEQVIAPTLLPVNTDAFTEQQPGKLVRITQWPMYRSDNLVRRALPLQACAANESVGRLYEFSYG
jgi:NADH-quinone oxidoreductase subunit G